MGTQTLTPIKSKQGQAQGLVLRNIRLTMTVLIINEIG
jgi:hypothetical protein